MVTTFPIHLNMVPLYLLALLWASAALAAPAHVDNTRSLSLFPRYDLCDIPLISYFACNGNAVQLVTTPMGLARGVQAAAGAVKFTIKYATAARFQPPVMATSWALPFVASFLA
jgi:hypothetical protein